MSLDTDQHMKYNPAHSPAQRLFYMTLPVTPAWLFGAFVLLSSPAVWEVVPSPGLSSSSPDLAVAWTLIGNVVLSSLLYAVAPIWGPNLTSVSPSYGGHSMRASTGVAADFGTVVLRGLALTSMYLVTFAIWRESA